MPVGAQVWTSVRRNASTSITTWATISHRALTWLLWQDRRIHSLARFTTTYGVTICLLHTALAIVSRLASAVRWSIETVHLIRLTSMKSMPQTSHTDSTAHGVCSAQASPLLPTSRCILVVAMLQATSTPITLCGMPLLPARS